MSSHDVSEIRNLHACAQQHLQKVLPGVRLTVQSLLRAQQLKLLLIDSEYDDRQLTQQQQNQLMDDPPYWIFCWASGHAQAEFLLNDQLVLTGKTVVDFGSGSGVGAIAAKKAGAKKVFAVDIDPFCRQLIYANALLNQVQIEIVDSLDQISEPIDMLMAADVLYEAANYPLLGYFLRYSPNVVLWDSRLKTMPDNRYAFYACMDSCSFPDFNEAREFNRVNIYLSEGFDGTLWKKRLA